MHQTFDIIIVGAGPAGCACAIQLAKALPSLRIALLDKGNFPKDKICGDALSPDVVTQVRMLSESLAMQLQQSSDAFCIKGLTIVADKGQAFSYHFEGNPSLEMYTCPRIHFDNLLFLHTQQYVNIQFINNCEVKEIQIKEESLLIQTIQGQIEGKLVVGADGAHSVVARKLGKVQMDKGYHAGALRVYYEGVQGLESGTIELHFINDIIPGYLWIFPLSNNSANIGLGMPSNRISEEKINLREKLQYLLAHHPSLIERFRNAKPLETIKGFGLPMGGKKNIISGERFLLLGDAASLIDPFTGEGIANAIRSGRVASEHIVSCLQENDFSAKKNQSYDKEIYRRMLPEFRISNRIKRIIHSFPFAFDIFIKLASKNQWLVQFSMNLLIRLHTK